MATHQDVQRHDGTGEAGLDPAVDVEGVLRARARALATPSDDARRTAGAPHLLVSVGRVSAALPIDRARHVVPLSRLARLPAGGPAVLGLVAALGTVSPVADTAVLLSVERSSGDGDQRLVLVDDGDDLLGLLVDGVEGLVVLGTESVAPSPVGSGIVRGVTADGSVVLDVDVLLADARLWPAGRAPVPPAEEDP